VARRRVIGNMGRSAIPDASRCISGECECLLRTGTYTVACCGEWDTVSALLSDAGDAVASEQVEELVMAIAYMDNVGMRPRSGGGEVSRRDATRWVSEVLVRSTRDVAL
jgi:hypothetical protein